MRIWPFRCYWTTPGDRATAIKIYPIFWIICCGDMITASVQILEVSISRPKLCGPFPLNSGQFFIRMMFTWIFKMVIKAFWQDFDRCSNRDAKFWLRNFIVVCMRSTIAGESSTLAFRLVSIYHRCQTVHSLVLFFFIWTLYIFNDSRIETRRGIRWKRK